MTSNRGRLSVREGTVLPVAHEGVPASLEPALRSWIWETISLDPDQAERVMIRLDLELPDSYWQRYQRELKKSEAEQARLDAEWEQKRARTQKAADAKPSASVLPSVPYVSREIAPSPSDPHAVYLAEGTDADVLWDVVDDLLNTLCIPPLPPGTPQWVTLKNRGALKRTQKITDPLRELLEDSRSVYEISPDQRGLRRRVDAVLAESVDLAGLGADTAGYPQARIHLERAHQKLFALHPDASGAYVDVILAVEAVANPMFLPNEQLPTLGKVRGHLKAEAGKYEYVLTSKQGTPGTIDSIIAMISSIWDGHSDRHAGGPLSVPVTQEAATAALTIAAALVTLFSSRAVHRTPTVPSLSNLVRIARRIGVIRQMVERSPVRAKARSDFPLCEAAGQGLLRCLESTCLRLQRARC
jgi:hypothetical protein